MAEQTEIREALVRYSRLLVARDLSGGTAGNLSVRIADRMLITPTSIPPDRMTAQQIVEIGFDGTHAGTGKPSSEWELHAKLYRNTEAGAVIHAHPTHCVALSCLREAMPAFHYMVASFGGDEVPCAPYRRFGSSDLADAVVDTMGRRYTACLMANHGMIAVDRTLDAAFARTEKLETLARQYHLARIAGDVRLLTAAEMDDVRDAYRSLGYGKVATDG